MLVFSSSTINSAAKEIQQNKDTEPYHATGLKEPAKEDLAWFKENRIEVKKILPNRIGLERANMARAERGLEALRSDEAAAINQDIVPMNAEAKTEESASIVRASESIEELDGTSLPDFVDNSTLPYFPPIRDQGTMGSCSAFAVTYYQFTYMNAMARGWDVRDNNDNSNKFSPKWTYNLSNGGKDEGSSNFEVYKVLSENGAATWEEFPYDGDRNRDKNYQEWCTDEKVWRNAMNYKIDKFGYVNVDDGTDTPVKSPDSNALNDVKRLLNNGYILTYSTTFETWKYKKTGDDLSTEKDDKFTGQTIVYAQGDNQAQGHHMTVVGYSDDIWVDINDNKIVEPAEKGAFKIANSWSKSWGNEGFAWLAYDSLNKVSAVSGAPEIPQRSTIWDSGNTAYWITVKPSNSEIIGEITLNHAKRNQIRIELGMEDTDGTNIRKVKPYFINLASVAECAFDGSQVPCDTTFIFDFKDLFKGENIEGVTKNWTIKVTDSKLDGNSAIIKSFKIINPSSDNSAICDQGNQTVDGGSVTLSVPFKLLHQDVEESQWRFKDYMPFSINYIQNTFVVDNKIYAFCQIPDKGTQGFICYDPLSRQTNYVSGAVPGVFSFMSSVSYNNKIYSFAYGNVNVYDFDTGNCTSKSIIPDEKMNSSIVELNGKIYVINGNNEEMAPDKGVKVYDPLTDKWSNAADTNVARAAANAVSFNGSIYLFGGRGEMSNRVKIIEKYDPANNKWTIIGNYTPFSTAAKFAVINNRLYVFTYGGQNSVYEYIPDVNQWIEQESIPEKYITFGMASTNGKAYILGGMLSGYSSISNEDSHSRNILEFDPSRGDTPNPALHKVTGYIKPSFINGDTASPLKKGFKVEIEGTSLSATTDNNGYFEISNVPENTTGYSLKISKPNYLYREIKNIKVASDIQLSSLSSPIDIYPGDILINGVQDNAINICDIMEIAIRFNTISGNALYSENCDLNMDGAINIIDIMIVAANFNTHFTDYANVTLV
jgi:C1A family cysteine protease